MIQCNQIYVSAHAIIRYRQRVRDCPDAEIRRCLTCRAIRIAAAFGAHYVRLGTGERVVLRGPAVVTVLPRQHETYLLDRRRQVGRDEQHSPSLQPRTEKEPL